ncbi:MAG: DUF3810 domain-containing protein [Burkholderiales bacterium]|nr:DUF3810 domain-containing protein [Flavobacterium sp.]
MSRKYILPLFLLLQILALRVVSFYPEIVEQYYSNGLYVGISNSFRVVLGKIPFSVGDLIYFTVLFFILRWLLKKRKSWKTDWKNNCLTILSSFSVAYLLFHLLWAINYYRTPLFEKMSINTEYSDKDLLVFTKKLIFKTNEIHCQLTQDENAKVVFPYSQQQVFEMNLNGYSNLARQYEFFAYRNKSVKKSLLSLPLTYMGFAGYLNPFTNEAQVNDLMPMYNFPTTTAHEMAHQLGYASESEANFIGYLASVKNDNLYFKYSGYCYALRYCLHNWEIRNPKLLNQLMLTINPGILKNYKESEAFWVQYESFIETGFKIFYDHFLKLNQQKDGLESYSKFVDLMVNYYKYRDL